MRRPLLTCISLLVAALLPPISAARACPGGAVPPGARPENEPPLSESARAFVIAPVEEDDGPVIAGAASPAAEEANRLFEAHRWEDAALAARAVTAGETGDSEMPRRLARYHQAISLAHLGFPEGSLALFTAVAERKTHPRFSETLRQIAILAEGREEQDRFAELVNHYDEQAIAQFDTPRDRALHDRLRYLQGIARARLRDHVQAIYALEKVSRESPLFLHARFRMGIGYVSLRKTVPAAKAFSTMAEAAGEGQPHLRDLALISMARAYYSSNHYLDEPCTPTIDGARLSAAVKYWNRISPESEYWPEALLESSWAYFMAGDYPHALGNLQVFESGYLQPTRAPEADLLRGLIAYTTCQYEDVVTWIARMQQRYRPVRAALTTLITTLAGEAQDEAVLTYFDALHAGMAAMSTPLEPLTERVLRDRRAHRERLRLHALDDEDAHLQRSSARLRSSALGREIAVSLRVARRVATHDLAVRIRTLHQDRLEDLDHQLLDGQKLLLDVARSEAEERLRRSEMGSSDLQGYGPIQPDVEHVIWPFDGEYWRDELGGYRHIVQSRCFNR
ncbi:MAG: hypothetical protein ABI193_06830 [Minicystis sp.]